jgi:hypothetical protein
MVSGAHGIGGHPLFNGDLAGGKDWYRTIEFVTAFYHEARVTELQANGTKLLDEARSARRETARAKFEAEVWREKALTFEATIRRIDPVWRGT